MASETDRGLTCHYYAVPHHIRNVDWIATVPNSEGKSLAHTATPTELKAEIDALLEDE